MYAGRAGTGMSDKELERLWRKLQPARGRQDATRRTSATGLLTILNFGLTLNSSNLAGELGYLGPLIAHQLAKMMSEHPLTDHRDVQPARPIERRDARRTLEHWVRNSSGDDRIPLLASFDFVSIKRDWDHRFLICIDQVVEGAAFVAYGTKFAKQLGLPAKVTAVIPLIQQITERYRPLFAEGCSTVMQKQVPARFSGAFESDFQIELFRAVFLPIRLQPSWSKWLIFGSFGCRTVLSVDRKGL
jgi:hypothetical protein